MTTRPGSTRRGAPRPGEVFWIDPNPVLGREMRDRHVRRFQDLSTKSLRLLLPLYEQLLQDSPDDVSSQRYVQVVRGLLQGAVR